MADTYNSAKAKPIKNDPMSDGDIQEACRRALRDSLGGPQTEIGVARLRNLEYYNAEATGDLAPPEIEDRSDFVATDVADTIEGMLPSIMRIFVGADHAVEFESRQPGQEQVAKLATEYVNYLFYTRNDGVGVLYDWFKDALIQKVGYVKVWAEDDFEDDEQTYEGQTQDQLVMLMQDGWELTGEPQQDEKGGLTFTVKKDGKSTAIKVAACAPHEVRVDGNARWGDEPAMIAHVFKRRKFELEEEGNDLSNIGTGTAAIDSRYDTETLEMMGVSADSVMGDPHPSHTLYNCAEIYIKLDADGDGIAEWLCCNMIEDKLVEHTKCDGHPFVWICPIPRPHSFFGDCPADFALQPQKLRTNIVRAIQDNLMLTVNTRTYINMEAGVNINDWLENRPGGVVRGNGPANNAFSPIVQPNLGAPAYEFNGWLDEWKAERTGFTKYSQGTDANALNHTATGIGIITQRSDARMELMCRFFAVGVKQLFAKMLKLAIQHQKQTDMVAINGQFVPINPSEWRNQFNAKIKVGLGTGSTEQKAARIMGLMQTMQFGIPAGVVGPENIAEAIRLYAVANEFQNPERFVNPHPTGMPPNPQAYQAEQQQNQQQMQQMQQQLEQGHQQIQQLTAQGYNKQTEYQIKQMELQQRAQEADQKHQHAMASLSVKAQADQGNIDVKAADVQRKQGETNLNGVVSMHGVVSDLGQQTEINDLKQQVDALTQAVQKLMGAEQGESQGE